MPPDSVVLELLMDAKCILFVLNYGMLEFGFSRMIILQWTTFTFLIYCSKLSHFKIYIVRLVSDENERFARKLTWPHYVIIPVL
jgi:hypothetical protein